MEEKNNLKELKLPEDPFAEKREMMQPSRLRKDLAEILIAESSDELEDLLSKSCQFIFYAENYLEKFNKHSSSAEEAKELEKLESANHALFRAKLERLRAYFILRGDEGVADMNDGEVALLALKWGIAL